MGLKAWDVPCPLLYIYIKVGVKDASLCGVPLAPSPSLQEGRDRVPGLCFKSRDTGRTPQGALRASSWYF